MSTYYIDGFTRWGNPTTEGGYTITDKDGNILARKFVKSTQENITNNYTEFLALFYCLQNFCEVNDTVFTDSQNSIAWSSGHFNKKSKRKDLIPLAQTINRLIKDKFINLAWIPREENIAGFTNYDIEYPL